MHFAFDEFEDIREGVRGVCAEFPDEYHRKIDHDRAYPEAFVAALTKAGWMAAQIPGNMVAPACLWRRRA